MRMRKKKHTPERMAAQSNITIQTPTDHLGKWKELSEGKPIHIEIGCGKGAFITTLARRNPDVFYVAFEKVPDVIVMAMEKIAGENIPNVRFVCGDAEMLTEVFQKDEVDRIYLNFSDPWPKKKHAKRRLTHSDFLARYRDILSPDGELIFKTDNRPLFDFSVEEMTAFGLSLSELCYDLHHSEYAADNIMTEYEKTFSEKGFSINRVVARFPRD